MSCEELKMDLSGPKIAGRGVKFLTLQGGDQISHCINNLAHLRIAVFKEYPYLYEGDMDYERKYLSTYVKADNALVVLATIDGEVIGATTAVPFRFEDELLHKPFIDNKIDTGSYIYFGESIILKEYRRHGIGKSFFKLRLNYARNLKDSDPKIKNACFCAVDRGDHPAMPDGYTTLDNFWEKQGFWRSKFNCTFPWKDIGDTKETFKKMVFYTKTL